MFTAASLNLSGLLLHLNQLRRAISVHISSHLASTLIVNIIILHPDGDSKRQSLLHHTHKTITIY